MFGSVIGSCLSQLEGLNAVYLPQGVSPIIAREIVERANSQRGDESNYSILIVPIGQPDGISSNQSLRYRQGDRLAVVTGRHPDLGSFNQSFHEVLGLNYPEIALNSVSIREVSSMALSEVVLQAGFQDDIVLNWDKAVSRIQVCLERAMGVHRELREGTTSWNVTWFSHIDLGLSQLCRLLQERGARNDISVDDFLSTYTFAAFGFSNPELNRSWSAKPSLLAESIKNFWADETSITQSIQYLIHHKETTEEDAATLGAVNWELFDNDLAAVDNHCLAFVRFAERDSNFIEALSVLSDKQFADPISGKETGTALVPFDADLRSLSVSGTIDDKAPYLALSSCNFDDGVWKSEILRISLPTTTSVDKPTLRKSKVRLLAQGSSDTWYGALETDIDGQLWAVGHIERKIKSSRCVADPRATRLSIDVPINDSLAGVAIAQISVQIYLCDPTSTGMWSIPVRTGGSPGKPTYWGPEDLNPDSAEEPETVYTVELDLGYPKQRYVVWTECELNPKLEGQALPHAQNRPYLFTIEDRTPQRSDLTVGELSFELFSSESSKATHSPIVAAITNARPTSDPLDAETMRSLRGSYESFAKDFLHAPFWLRSLGHLAVPSDKSYNNFPVDEVSDSGILLSPDLAKIWPDISDFEVPRELINSPAAEEFRLAFSALEIRVRLTQEAGSGDLTQVLIPSKGSWRSLWHGDRSLLTRYLDAYRDLIVEARRNYGAAGTFWATYPMSISIWSTVDGARCLSVLLSPLHPIRLAWLAGVEDTLWTSDLAPYLAGTIEGWNLPLLGPGDTEGSRFLAVPLESGQDQVFLGWSLLLRAATDEHRSLSSPENAGNLAVPGSAASGINATAVSAAMRSYRKINPHLTTITIDLAALSQSNRLHEIDEAVLSEIGVWASEEANSLFGGARILDSTKRAGDPPVEKMARLVGRTHGTPLSWKRYEPDATAMKQCDIRILQEAGVNFQVKSGGNESRLGVLGNVPLRRFEAVDPKMSSRSGSISSPTLRDDQGWAPLSEALRQCEGESATTLVSTKLFRAALVHASAGWTITGEAMMNPSAIASMVNSSSSGQQMLWEWRPPFLESSKDVPALERRPFVSVARVPQGFRRQLATLLAKANGKPVDDLKVDKLLGKLGARGVGLSSMLSMGGTHAAGALGFYLVFELMERVAENTGNTYVLPIDACDSFLRALAKDAKHAGLTQRADLLILRVENDVVTFSPVEIKFYDLDAENPTGHLPMPFEASMDGPLGQARATHSLLTGLQTTSNEINSSGTDADRALWGNALTALVEAAVRLHPDNSAEPEALAKAMSNLANGKSKVQIGRPIVSFFRFEATTPNGEKSLVWSGQRDNDTPEAAFGLLAADVTTAFESVESIDTTLVDEWVKLVEWALATTNEKSSQAASTHLSTDTWSGGKAAEVEDQIVEVFSHEEPQGSQLPIHPHTDVELNSGNSERFEPSGNTDAAEAEILDSAEPSPDDSPRSVPNFVNGIQGDGVRFPVGRLLGYTGNAMADFWPGNTDLNQMNVGVVGDLGTGKTQLMQALIFQMRKSAAENQETPLSMLIFDYKRDFQEPEFLDSVGGQVLRIDNIPLNFFVLREGYTPMAANQRANEFIDVLDKIYGGIGPVQKDRLSVTISDLYREDKASPPTIGRILERYSDGDRIDAVTALLRKFVNSEVFSEDPASFKSFSELINNKVLVVALNDFGTDDDGKNALVVMFLNLYYDYMLNSKKWPFSGENPQLRRLSSFLVVDEAVNIMRFKFPVLMNLLLQGRQFGFGVMLASQYLSHFKKDQENYGEPLLTWFIHKVKSVSPRDLGQLGMVGNVADLAERVGQLAKHQTLYRSLGCSGRVIDGTPFYKLVPDA